MALRNPPRRSGPPQRSAVEGCAAVLYKYAGICSSLNHARRTYRRGAPPRDFGTGGGASRPCSKSRRPGPPAGTAATSKSGRRPGAAGHPLLHLHVAANLYRVDTRLNIGPKGFTGEKYGGVTYWDTGGLLPAVLPGHRRAAVARRTARLPLQPARQGHRKRREAGASATVRRFYPMVTVNGEECHNEWEITFEEIHRNGAVAYAIFNCIRYTGDTAYLADCGLEVLLSVARFWAQRITWSGARRKYVMLGVTGPNEYENNVDNNWYTSYIACWSMRYAAESAAWVRENRPADYARICAKRRFDETAETSGGSKIADGMYFGEDRELGIFLQQDGYLDKEQTLAKDLDPADRPINQRWSWDRILRSCLIKQADVLQGLYFFGDDFDLDTVRRNFRFYEARTVHESSLSPCVHAILAARIGDLDKAYELYLRTARLDLDDYNREVREGCHVTSMAGFVALGGRGFRGACASATACCRSTRSCRPRGSPSPSRSISGTGSDGPDHPMRSRWRTKVPPSNLKSARAPADRGQGNMNCEL